MCTTFKKKQKTKQNVTLKCQCDSPKMCPEFMTEKI